MRTVLVSLKLAESIRLLEESKVEKLKELVGL